MKKKAVVLFAVLKIVRNFAPIIDLYLIENQHRLSVEVILLMLGIDLPGAKE